MLLREGVSLPCFLAICLSQGPSHHRSGWSSRANHAPWTMPMGQILTRSSRNRYWRPLPSANEEADTGKNFRSLPVVRQLLNRVQASDWLVVLRSKSLSVLRGATSPSLSPPSPGCELLEQSDYTWSGFCIFIFCLKRWSGQGMT